jgi:nucleoid-associated protein YgaU
MCFSRSLRISGGAACAVLMLGVGVACGGGAASQTPTAAPNTSGAPAAVASPQRPPLASPVGSPSPSTSASVAGGTPSAGASPNTAGGETYEVQAGDTLGTIAQKFYGDPAQWQPIYDANKDAIGPDPDKLKLGMQLKIPPKPS